MANTVACGFILILALFCQVQGECAFKCITDREFQQGGQEFSCGEQKCNLYNAAGDCEPCLDAERICVNNFTCEDSSPETVKFKVNPIKCPPLHVCNKEGEDNCIPCVHTPCNSVPYWECDPKDPLKTTVMGLPSRCERGTICNSDNKPPCSACIVQK